MDRVAHAADDGRYRNEAELMKIGVWTPLMPPERGPISVRGVVHKPDTEHGRTVERDSLSRVPVRLYITQEQPEPAAAGDDEPGSPADHNDEPGALVAEPPPGPELLLPVVAPGAGGEHGFVPGHRQGDVCQVTVLHPMAAEIASFSYADHGSVREDLLDVSMGTLVDTRDESWSGIVFRPGQAVAEEEKTLERRWRQGQD